MVPTDRHVHTNTHSRQETQTARKTSTDTHAGGRKTVGNRYTHEGTKICPGDLESCLEQAKTHTTACTHEVHYTYRARAQLEELASHCTNLRIGFPRVHGAESE